MISKREWSTIIAALRHWQTSIMKGGSETTDAKNARALMPDHFADDDEPLNGDDIDDMVERLNCSESNTFLVKANGLSLFVDDGTETLLATMGGPNSPMTCAELKLYCETLASCWNSYR